MYGYHSAVELVSPVEQTDENGDCAQKHCQEGGQTGIQENLLD